MIIGVSLLIAVFTALICVVVYYTKFCMEACPTDPAIHKQRELEHQNKEYLFDAEIGGINGGKLALFCTVCDKYVEE